MASSSDTAGNSAAQNPSNQPGGVPPASGNPYSARLESLGSRSQPDLDANAPVLKASEMRRLNRRALVFLAALVVLIALAAVWMFNNVVRRPAPPPQPQKEVVKVPEAPKPPPFTPAQAQPQSKAPIPVAPERQPALPQQVAAQQPHGPTLMERRMMDSNAPPAIGVNGEDAMFQQQMAGLSGGMPGIPALGASAAADSDTTPPEYRMPSNKAYNAPALAKTSSAQPLPHPDAIMTRGTYIRCVLETYVNTDVPGFTTCIVTEPVYSFTGKRLLLPKGSKLLGQYGTAPTSERLAVIWDRIITPTGIDVNMASPGMDNIGGAGLPGYLDNHWGERIGAALLISVLSDAFSYEAAKHGPSTTTVTSNMAVESPWQSNTAQTLQSLANQAVRQAANRPPTLTINQGTVIYVYVARDVDFTGVLARS